MIRFTLVNMAELPQVLDLFKSAAERIDKMNVDHWQYWKNPPPDKVDWVKEGIDKKEFFFIENQQNQRLGMIRILKEDLLYWGEQSASARYIHSLVIKEEFKGKGLGKEVLAQVYEEAKNNGCEFLRLDADSSNTRLCSYYLDLGFQSKGFKELNGLRYNLMEKEIT